jgi:hypothetical protein
MNTAQFPGIVKAAFISALLVFVLHCGGESGGGGASVTEPTPPPNPGPSYFISGAITSVDQWEGVPSFDVRHEGTRDVGGFTTGSQALYPCDNVTCDCAGNCTYQISTYNGIYEVSVYIASEYGEHVVTPPMHVVTVSGANVGGQDFAVE